MINEVFSDPEDIRIVELYVRDLLDHIDQYLPHVCINTVRRAIDFAIINHKQQRRASGEPYVIHPLATAKILVELNLDTQTIVAGLLHDIIEDTSCSLKNVEDEFGKKVSQLVTGLTKISQVESNSNTCNRAENLRRLLIAVAEDARVLLIKLADRLHNMQTINGINDHRKKLKIAKETLDVYAPLAERIGMHFFKNILYDMSFECLYPDVRQSIVYQVDLLKSRGEHDINLIISDISSIMIRNNLDVEVQGREKEPFSIWQKMERKKVYFDELSDIFAIRIITKQSIDCYSVLGLIHMHYKVISKEFFDYISCPKQNGYQSIHTVIFITESIKVEIQIRTMEMHRISELGMAAHWVYKSNEDLENNNNQQEWLGKIRSIMENLTESEDILSNVRLEMYNDQVFCFTPNGDVVALPKDSTPLDFAFEVSTELGILFSKAIVNGNSVPINTQLKNGDQVEILTGDNSIITSSWLNIVRTNKAKNEIKVYLDKKLFDSIVLSGNIMLHEECTKYDLNLSEDKIYEIAKDHNMEANEFIFNIGNGSIDVESVVTKLSGFSFYSKLGQTIKKLLFGKPKQAKTFSLQHLKHIAEIHFAYCCNPSESKNIIGVYNNDKGSVIIHSERCLETSTLNHNEEIINLSMTGLFHEGLEVKIKIVLDKLIAIDTIFTLLTNFGISKYTVDVSHSNDQENIVSINAQIVIPHQIEILIDKLKNILGVRDVSIE